MASEVFFTDFRMVNGRSITEKLQALIKAAGIEKIDMKNKFVAIKIHFGEAGNMGFLRPNFAKAVADVVKELGGKPFLTDCSTLYVGKRKNALEHLEVAYENGFSPFSTGCHILMADGLKGTDEAFVEVKNGEYVKYAKLGRAIVDADVVITLNHFKGHATAGFGGALKNLGMGCGSKAGKMEQHCSGKPAVKQEKCVGCRKCSLECAHSAISFTDRKASIDHSKCVGCGRCLGECNFDAIYNPNYEASVDLNKKIAEYAQAVCQDKPTFHINIANNITPLCDCRKLTDSAIIPDVGMFASFDPVAIDVAAADACNKMPIIDNSLLGDHDHKHCGCDHFSNANPNTDWTACTNHAEKIGLGCTEYNLIELKL